MNSVLFEGEDTRVGAAGPRRTAVRSRVTALRPAHWLKNLLIFAPLMAAHKFQDVALLQKSVLAFIAFGLCASAGYIFNDLIDLESDRYHPHKRLRPFASGCLPLSYGLIAIPVLVISGGALAVFVSPLLSATLLGYFVLSTAYSLKIKNVALLDVLFLAALYTVRIMAGSVATGIWVSHWLLAFSIFFFFGLALLKRYGELVVMHRSDGDDAKARAYEFGDRELLVAMGLASGYLAVLVLALYVATDQAPRLYGRGEVLWILCPLLLYWTSHIWLMAHRGHMTGDPLEFATRDRTSLILVVVMTITVALAL